jgi:hypothetical protein
MLLADFVPFSPAFFSFSPAFWALFPALSAAPANLFNEAAPPPPSKESTFFFRVPKDVFRLRISFFSFRRFDIPLDTSKPIFSVMTAQSRSFL